MRSKLRGCDVLARIGGDEFGVLLECCSGETALRIAEALRQTVKDFRFVWPNNVFRIGASIGLASFGNDGVTFPEVLRRADAACYVAKAAGRNRVHVFTPDDKEVEKRAGELQWLRRIQKALDTQQFVLYSQRIVPLRKDGGLLPHNEILLRCRDESGKLVSPAVFVPAAERYGFMPQIDRWVIATVFSQYAQAHVHCDEKRAPLYAINVSGTSIGDSGFLDFVREQFRRHQVPPQAICFEITETSAIANLTEAASLMEDLKAMGCRIALDDFGSGMSSFGYLKHLPVDFLKIDGSLVKDILDDPVSFAMVDSVNRIGHVMGIQTIAEFAENEAILDVLRGMGVDYAQGYGVQRPVPMRIAG
jgi:EAL domain-containing protein (putative c-di-GMP-specific phosphodiesterase class I)